VVQLQVWGVGVGGRVGVFARTHSRTLLRCLHTLPPLPLTLAKSCLLLIIALALSVSGTLAVSHSSESASFEKTRVETRVLIYIYAHLFPVPFTPYYPFFCKCSVFLRK
jgi:hypothetical protein